MKGVRVVHTTGGTAATASVQGTIDFALDTDIGTDVDDILAIGTILGSPELHLARVTTAYGDTRLRAQMVARTVRVAGVPRVPAIPGARETLSGRPVWWPGHEGKLMADLETEVIDDDLDAAAELAAATTILAIAPLTNVATSMRRSDSRTERLVMMGGEFTDGYAEHNIKCDVTAASIVFSSSVPVVAVGIDQTERVRLTRDELAAIRSAGELGPLLSAEIEQFWRFTGRDYNVPHDPIAAVLLARPDLFELAAGHVTVGQTGQEEGLTVFAPDPAGPHRIVTDLDADAVAHEVLTRIVRGCTMPSS